MDLRDYQEDLVFNQLYGKLSEGDQRVCVVAPTGAGKTIVSCQIIKDLVEEGCTVMFVCHLDQLVIQTAQKLAAYGIETDQIGFITGGRQESRNRPIQVASIQSLARRAWWRDRFWGAVILDECHLTAFRKASAHFFSDDHEGLTIGLTATPYRLKKTEGLVTFFQSLVQAPTPMALTEMGHLSPLRYWGFGKAGSIDTTGVKTVAGDFSKSDLEQACAKPELLNHAVKQWQKLALGKKTLCFCTSVKHAEGLRDEFLRQDITAEMVCGETPRDERQQIYQRLSDGKTQVVTSVDVLAIGFDLPCAEALLLARPTKSKAIHLQQLGRGARPLKGKEFCTVLDQAGNVLKYGFLTDDGPWSLDIPEEQGEPGDAPVKQCDPDDEGCGAVVHASLMVCPECGKPFPVKKKRSRTDDLTELQAKKPKLSKEHRAMQSFIRKGHQKGYLPNWALMRFEEQFGYVPHPSLWLHALVEKPEDKHLDQFATYLGLLCKDKDRPWSLALTSLVREFGPQFMEGRVDRARVLWQAAYDTQPMTLSAAAFGGPPRKSEPREGSLAGNVLYVLSKYQPACLSIKGIAADIASRYPRMTQKKQVQLEATVRKSVQRLRDGGWIEVGETVPGSGGNDMNKYRAVENV